MKKGSIFYYILFFIIIVTFPIFIKNNYYISLANFIGIYSIVSLGTVILLGYAGQISIGQSGFYAIGAYTSALLSLKLGFPFWISFIGAMLISIFIGSLIGLVALRIKGNYLAMATIGFSILIYVMLKEFYLLTGGVYGLRDIPSPSIGIFSFDNDFKYFYLVWIIFCSLLIFSRNIVNSRIGRAMFAIKYDEEASEVFGISIVKYKIKAFIISSCYSSIGGILFAHYLHFIDPEAFHLSFSFMILFIVVIGGIESLWGVILGSLFFVGLAEIFKKMSSLHFLPLQLKSLLVDYSYISIVLSLITILILIFLPKGVSNLFSSTNK